MARIVFTRKAANSIRKLPKDKGLLRSIWQVLEQTAADPDEYLLPPAFPHAHPMRNFEVYDESGQRWGVTALATFDADEDVLLIILIYAGELADEFEIE